MLVSLLLLVTIEMDSTLRVDLQYLASWPRKFGVHEGFIACEIFFFHSSGCEEGHSFLCIFEGGHVRGCGGVEVEAAFAVTLACKVVIY